MLSIGKVFASPSRAKQFARLFPQFSLCSNCGPTGSLPRARSVPGENELLSVLRYSTRSTERVPLARLRLPVNPTKIYSTEGMLRLRYFLWTHGESNPDLFHAMEPFYRYTMGPTENRNEYTTFISFERRPYTVPLISLYTERMSVLHIISPANDFGPYVKEARVLMNSADQRYTL